MTHPIFCRLFKRGNGDSAVPIPKAVPAGTDRAMQRMAFPPALQIFKLSGGLNKIRSVLDTPEIKFFILTKRHSRTIMINAQQYYADVLELVDWLA